MEINKTDEWPVSGFDEWQKFETTLATYARDDGFNIGMEGDTVIDDGWMGYAVFGMDLSVEEVRLIHKEMSEWLMKKVPGLGVYTIQFRDVLIDDGNS